MRTVVVGTSTRVIDVGWVSSPRQFSSTVI